ncbi:MAG: sensor histidine kinase, partial [Chloroflexota bacterium]
EQEGVRVMASAGYTSELAPYQDALLPIVWPILRESIQTGQPQNLISHNGDGNAGLLATAKSQIGIPIRQEEQTVGILLLESQKNENCPAETLAFLTRLTDHAAIAIANAQLYSEVQSANMAKSKFVSFVAHELKNPMASIKGYTELVSSGMAGPINEMQTSFLATVSTNLDRMNTIVSDLNDLTKIEVGSLRLEFKAVQVKDIIDEVVRSMRKQIDEKEQKLIFAIPDQLALVWGDPSRLSQILTNLISNAFKYTPQGGTITVGAERCANPADSSAVVDVVHIWVQDTGIGIREEDQDKIFQQYFRTELSKDIAPGTGLGLNITKTLVEMQGGTIWFNSELNKGTTFHFTVPVVETA